MMSKDLNFSVSWSDEISYHLNGTLCFLPLLIDIIIILVKILLYSFNPHFPTWGGFVQGGENLLHLPNQLWMMHASSIFMHDMLMCPHACYAMFSLVINVAFFPLPQNHIVIPIMQFALICTVSRSKPRVLIQFISPIILSNKCPS